MILRRLPETPRKRLDLQVAGERLDRETGGQWVADDLAKFTYRNPSVPGVVVDAVLIPQQVERVRRAAQGSVIHIHLTAPLHQLEARYASKRSGIEESGSYSDLLGSTTEANVDQLAKHADLVFDTDTTSLDDEIALVVKRIGQQASQERRR